MEKITYIGKRITTKNILGHFFLKKDGTEFGRTKLEIAVEIGEICSLNADKEISILLPAAAASAKDIANYTQQHLAAETAYKAKHRRKPVLISTKIKQLIREVNALELSGWDRLQLAQAIYEQIKNGK